MRVTCVRNMRPDDLVEGKAVVVQNVDNPAFYTAATVGKITDRLGAKSFNVTPQIGEEISASFSKRNVETASPIDTVFVECDPTDVSAMPVRVVDVLGHTFSLEIQMEGTSIEASRQAVQLAFVTAGLDFVETSVRAYADLPGSTPPSAKSSLKGRPKGRLPRSETRPDVPPGPEVSEVVTGSGVDTLETDPVGAAI